MEIPVYVSHKEVHALKIARVQEDGHGQVELDFVDTNFHRVRVSIENRPKPEVGWYFVIYADGYHSFSPGKQFEEGYTRKQ